MTLVLPRLQSMRLDGRRAVVTGAGRGIGLAAAAALAQVGAEVTLVARSQVEIEAAARAIRDDGGHAEAVVLDVTDGDRVTAFFRERPAFNVLVNNAGTNRPKPLVDASDEDLDAVLGLNVHAAMRVAREWARPLLVERKPGSLINISSQMGHVGAPQRSLYCASKHALEGFTKALAWEWGAAGIRVNTLCPTFVETELTRPMLADDTFRGWVLSKIALGRVGTVQDMMGAIVFLATDASALVTGSALMVDGGWTAT